MIFVRLYKKIYTHTHIYVYIYIYIYMVQACNPPLPPPAMVMVPRVGCTISLESNYHARYLCFPAPPCGVGWVQYVCTYVGW